jgi:hypothetical protein
MWELWSAIATVGSFFVLTAAAAAALIQLNHLRSSNQLQALASLGDEFQQIAPQIGFVLGELPRKMEDPQFRREIGTVLDPQRHPELLVAVFFDQFGLLVKLGLMQENFILEYGGGADTIWRCWKNLEGVLAIRRRHAPTVYQNFEFLAMRAHRWLEQYPDGNYPAGQPRLPLTDRWEQDEA